MFSKIKNFEFDLAFKLRLFYFFACGVGGVTYFFSIWFGHKEISVEQIGLIMSMASLSKVFFGSLAASLSDKGIDSKYISAALALMGGVGSSLLLLDSNTIVYMVGVFIATGGFSSNYLICENMTVSAARSKKIRQGYAKIRVTGTLSYAFFAVFTGYLVKRFLDVDENLLVYLMLFCSVSMFIISFVVTDVRDLNFIRQNRAKLGELFKQKDFKRVIAIVILFWTSFGMQSGFGPLYWEGLGISPMIIGYFVLPMIISETLLFLNVKKFFNSVPYQTFFIISTSMMIVRWWLLAFATTPPVIISALLLHGFTYGCSHLGMMHYIRDVIPENMSTRAQAMYSILAGGVFSGLSIIGFGFIYEDLQGKCFLVSAAISLIAFVIALHLKGVRFRVKKRPKAGAS
jgi:PPP family 3-phenylpropionic acid transporter